MNAYELLQTWVNVRPAQGSDLDALAATFNIRRRKRWSWVPDWLKISWLRESDQGLRQRVLGVIIPRYRTALFEERE